MKPTEKAPDTTPEKPKEKKPPFTFTFTDKETGKQYKVHTEEAPREIPWNFTDETDNNPQEIFDTIGNCFITPGKGGGGNAYRITRIKPQESPESPKEGFIVAIRGEDMIIYRKDPERIIATRIPNISTTEKPVSRLKKFLSVVSGGITEVKQDGKTTYIRDGEDSQIQTIDNIDTYGNSVKLRVNRQITKWEEIVENTLSCIYHTLTKNGCPVPLSYAQIANVITGGNGNAHPKKNLLEEVKEAVEALRNTHASIQRVISSHYENGEEIEILDEWKESPVIMADLRKISSKDGRDWDGIILYREGLYSNFFRTTKTLKTFDKKLFLPPPGIKKTKENICISHIFGELNVLALRNPKENKYTFEYVMKEEGDPGLVEDDPQPDLFCTQKRIRKGETPEEKKIIRKRKSQKLKQYKKIAQAFTEAGIPLEICENEGGKSKPGIKAHPPRKARKTDPATTQTETPELPEEQPQKKD